MHDGRWTGRRSAVSAALALAAACLVTVSATAQAPRALVPESFPLNASARRAIEAEWLTEDERSMLRVRHGVWDERDLRTPTARALVALNAWTFDDPALSDPAVPAVLRAEARRRLGALREAIDLVQEETSIRAVRIRAEALEGLGAYEQASAVIAPVVRRLEASAIDDASELTEGVRILAVRARLEGQPARDYQTMMSLLGRAHQELDRLYWPARLTEAELLIDKHNRREAVAALHETLGLNPRCTEAWYALGRVALAQFDFRSTQIAVDAIRRSHSEHPLADLLHAESRLVQNDPDEALTVLRRLVDRRPMLRPAHALIAAATAMQYDEPATAAALARCAELSPASAEAHYTVGRFLSMFRQYDEAAAALEEAMRRQPAWPAPRLELGLMEMQTGRDDKALSVLREVVELDPFNKQAANSLFLLEEIADYVERETEHFVIRYRPGVDEVLADLMPEALEAIHARVHARFGWELDESTIIEIMPDHKRFAVRITGMPHIHTIAACTGPIIAMEVPREGKASMHRGAFDWVRVIQHEYTHTVTLDQTKYRIPHWLTEAAAVSMEMAPRDYVDCLLLARSYEAGTLFDLDEIKWAFVRPKRPEDRGKAYAQGHWMVEYLDERFGPQALIDLLARYFEGEREEEAIAHALSITREEFVRGFLAWAGGQVRSWGLAPEPSMRALTDELRWKDPDLALLMVASEEARLNAIVEVMTRRIGRPARPGERPFTSQHWPELVRPPVEVSNEQLAAWRGAFPDHPDLLELKLRRLIEDGDVPLEELVPMLERYAALRPVDPFPHRRLAQIHLAGPDPSLAIEHLEALDAREQKTSVYAVRLAKLYRERGDRALALTKVTRAVQMDPYDVPNRELAAAIAVEAGALETARLHVKAMTLLEPDRPHHRQRLDRLDQLLAERGRQARAG